MGIKQSVSRLVIGTCAFVFVVGLALNLALATRVFATPIGGERVAVLSPFVAGVTTGDESPSTHPAHNSGFGFGWDMHGGAGTAVYPRVATTDGAITMKVVNISPSSTGAGSSVDVEVKVDSTAVGKLRYGHLVNLGVVENQENITTATRLGDTAPNQSYGGCKGFPCSSSWQVSTTQGIHTHMEFSKACYGPQGLSAAVNANAGFALLSQNYGTTHVGSCDSTELSQVSSGTPPFVATNEYYLNYNFDTQHNLLTTYGNYGDKFVSGDWNGDGTDTLGVRQNNVFHLNNSFDGTSDHSFAFGNADMGIMAGNWDGDGGDGVGVRYGNTFYLDNNLDGVTDKQFSFGNPGDWVVVGNWDGEGGDGIAVRQNNTFYFDNNLDGVAEFSLNYGDAGIPALAGNWDGTDGDGLGVRYGNTYYLDNDLDGQADTVTSYGSANDHMLAGDWDNDVYNTDTLGIRRVIQQ